MADAVAEIEVLMPSWKPLLDLPVTFCVLLEPEVISCSCFAFPQHIFLSPPLFKNRVALQEQVLHELCHNWTYLVEELCPLYDNSRRQSFELPSGTADRNIGEVLGAGYVAAVLGRWYRAKGGYPHYLRSLAEYLRQCLALSRHDRTLLGPGRSLRRALQACSRRRTP